MNAEEAGRNDGDAGNGATKHTQMEGCTRVAFESPNRADSLQPALLFESHSRVTQYVPQSPLSPACPRKFPTPCVPPLSHARKASLLASAGV